MNWTVRNIEFALPVLAITFGVFGVVLPAVVLGFVRKTMAEHEHLAGPVLLAGTVICVTGIVVGAASLLAAIGWLPQPQHWFPG